MQGKITEKTPINTSRLKAEVIVPLKCLSNFLRSLDFPLTKWEIELYLWWSKECIITEVSRTFRAVDPNTDPVVVWISNNNN